MYKRIDNGYITGTVFIDSAFQCRKVSRISQLITSSSHRIHLAFLFEKLKRNTEVVPQSWLMTKLEASIPLKFHRS